MYLVILQWSFYILLQSKRKIVRRGKIRFKATKREDETGPLRVNEGRLWISLPRVRGVQIVFTADRLLSRGSRCCVIFCLRTHKCAPRVASRLIRVSSCSTLSLRTTNHKRSFMAFWILSERKREWFFKEKSKYFQEPGFVTIRILD